MNATDTQSEHGPQASAAATGAAPQTTPPAIAQWEVEEIIRKRVYGAAVLGFAPVAVLDLVGLYALQVELVRALAHKYDVPFRADRANALIVSLVGSVLPISLVPIMASLFKMLPVVGQTTSASTISLLGGAATYAVGHVFARHFATGGTLLEAQKETFIDPFKSKYEEGKAAVKRLGKKGAPTASPPADEPIVTA